MIMPVRFNKNKIQIKQGIKDLNGNTIYPAGEYSILERFENGWMRVDGMGIIGAVKLPIRGV